MLTGSHPFHMIVKTIVIKDAHHVKMLLHSLCSSSSIVTVVPFPSSESIEIWPSISFAMF